MSDSDEGVVRSVYEVIPVPLNVVMTDKPYKTDARVLIAGKCPISLWIRINSLSAPLIDLATYRALRLPIKRFYLTTTETSAESAELILSNDLNIDLLGLGANVSLVDNVGAYYDGRATREHELVNNATVIADGATETIAYHVTTGYNKIIGTIYSDRALTVYVDQSRDGTNVSITETIPYVGGALTGGFSVEVVAPYVQLRFNNASGLVTGTCRKTAHLSTGA